jgi:putative colanic acid biosynthesis glycosyltransferase
MTRLSVVTVHLYDIPGLARTQQSLERVLESPILEWIIVDGGTRPESAEHERKLDQASKAATRYVSEPDEGIYDAMNKGTGLVSGDYVLYLNAGDLLHPDFDLGRTLEVCDMQRPGMIWSDAWDRNRKGRSYPRRTRKAYWLRYGMTACHQAIWFRRDLLGSRPYDTTFRIAADYDLLCRLYRDGAEIAYLKVPVCVFDLVGESSMHREESGAEESAVRTRHFGIPRFLDRALVRFKQAHWSFNMKYPGVRAVWRRWL